QLSEDSPEINSENLLVLILPAIIVYGVSFFFLLLDELSFPLPLLRYLVIGLFGVLVSLPLICTIIPRTSPVPYPPYHPFYIQPYSGWLTEKELAMSDIPSGVAWYGRRQCMLVTLTVQDDFFAVNDYQKPVSLLYLTPVTLNTSFQAQW